MHLQFSLSYYLQISFSMTFLTMTELTFNFFIVSAQNVSIMQYNVSAYVDDIVSSDKTDKMLLK